MKITVENMGKYNVRKIEKSIMKKAVRYAIDMMKNYIMPYDLCDCGDTYEKQLENILEAIIFDDSYIAVNVISGRDLKYANAFLKKIESLKKETEKNEIIKAHNEAFKDWR